MAEALPKTPHNPSKASCLALALAGRMVRKAGEREAEHGSSSITKAAIDALLSRRIAHLGPLDDERHAAVKTVTEAASLWHGTGRYQYKQGGRIVDVLKRIAVTGEIATNYDQYDISAGPMHSISLAKSRMYARAYADMHINQRRRDGEPLRHGSAIFWASVFIGDWALEFAREQGGYRNARDQMRNAGSDNWHNKINASPLDIRAGFTQGSDINGNYPVLFGVDSARNTRTSGSFALHEVRTRHPISLMRVTHIEVPQDRIAPTEALFAEYGKHQPTVASIEDAERYASTFSFSELMGVEPVSSCSRLTQQSGLQEVDMYRACGPYTAIM